MRSEVEWAEMRERHRHGESISKLAREFGVTRNTIRKYVNATGPPKYELGSSKPSQLDPFKDYIRGRLAEFDLSATRILEEVQKMGYAGQYTVVKDFVRPIKRDRAVRAEIRFETKPGEQSQVD
jgi:transposase